MFRYATYADFLPAGLSHAERFALVARAGFEGLELGSVADADAVRRIADAAAQANIAIHAVYVRDNWRRDLASHAAAEQAQAVRSTLAALQCAKAWGADAVLLIPARVQDDISHAAAWERSRRIIRDEILPVAAQLGVTVGFENVWSGFLLSPLEYAQYIDSFESPWVRAYFDVGNVITGHPEHWIRILGPRIVKLHVKDFRFDNRHLGRYRVATHRLGDGTLCWPGIVAALAEVGFSGWITNTCLYSHPVQGFNAVMKRLPANWATTSAQTLLARHALADGAARMRKIFPNERRTESERRVNRGLSTAR